MAAGILISRIVGLVRQRVFAHYFGQFDEADAFYAAFRVPNFLQNLFGEGVLSASFIPVYARLLAEGDEEEAGRVAGAVGAILALATSVIVLVGVLLTPYLIWIIAPWFPGAKRELTIRLVRILFPGAGLLVFSAWSLGILNSHRKFFLSYTAPVIWNAGDDRDHGGLPRRGSQRRSRSTSPGAPWSGSAYSSSCSCPRCSALTRKLRLRLDYRAANVREVMRNFAPVFVSRGVVQISAYVDQSIASKLGEGAVAALTNAQSIYTLPVSLFGMAVSAAELPAMSSALGTETEVAARLRQRLNSGLRQIAFFIVPSAMAFFALGDVIAAALLRIRQIHATRTQSTSGESSPGRLSDCWPPRSAASTPPPTTRCAIRGHRCATRHCASRSPSVWDTYAPFPSRAGSASTSIGAPRD